MPLVPTSAMFLALPAVHAVTFRSQTQELTASATVARTTPTRPAPPHQETSVSVEVDLEPTLAMEPFGNGHS